MIEERDRDQWELNPVTNERDFLLRGWAEKISRFDMKSWDLDRNDVDWSWKCCDLKHVKD